MIRWPERYAPEKTHVHVKNELEMDVKPEAAWAWLVRAKLWPTWYANSENVEVEGGGPDLKAGVSFRWKTFGVTLDSKVEAFVPSERLGWTARGMGIDAYHAWMIVGTPSGCHVITEETQLGLLPRLNKAVRPNHMSRKHQEWLEGLLAKARTGIPT